MWNYGLGLVDDHQKQKLLVRFTVEQYNKTPQTVHRIAYTIPS